MEFTEFYKERVINDVETSLKMDIDKSETLLKAWEDVTYPTKKDGTPFKVLSKNIKGATLEADTIAANFGLKDIEKTLKVYACSNRQGYIEDEILAYESISDYCECEKAKEKPQNVVTVTTTWYTRSYYVYDIDDIKEAVNDKIEQCKKDIETYKEDLQNAKSAAYRYYDALSNAKKELLKSVTSYTAYTINNNMPSYGSL